MYKLKTLLDSDFTLNYKHFPEGTFDDIILLVCSFLKRFLLYGIQYGIKYGNNPDSAEGVGDLEVDDSYSSKLFAMFYLGVYRGYSPDLNDIYLDLIMAEAFRDDQLIDLELAKMLVMRTFIKLINRISRESLIWLHDLTNRLCSGEIRSLVENDIAIINSRFKGV